MIRFILLLPIVLLYGCASTYRQEAVTIPSVKLERNKAVFIATPKNGFYDTKEYKASGQQTASAVQSAFVRFSNKVAVSSRCADATCLKSEANDRNGYFVIPQILHWEDRNTEWSGIPDRIEMNLIIIDSQSNQELASTVISGKSKWATFGGDHPQDLLPEPIKKYIEELY